MVAATIWVAPRHYCAIGFQSGVGEILLALRNEDLRRRHNCSHFCLCCRSCTLNLGACCQIVAVHVDKLQRLLRQPLRQEVQVPKVRLRHDPGFANSCARRRADRYADEVEALLLNELLRSAVSWKIIVWRIDGHDLRSAEKLVTKRGG